METKEGFTTIELNGIMYECLIDHKNALDKEALVARYSEILQRYDYIVGDWGYNQLRLKGLFEDNHPKATNENKISFLNEYLLEYCNFGCSYFLLKRRKK